MIDVCEKGAVEVTRTLKTFPAISKHQDLIKAGMRVQALWPTQCFSLEEYSVAD
jgi:hypothetical protein